MPSIYRTVFATTAPDRQGERFAKEDLEYLLRSMPAVVHLGVEHDVGSASGATATAFGLHRADDGENWEIRGVIRVPDGEAPPRAGVSPSATVDMEDVVPEPLIACYLPFPVYKDDARFQGLRDSGLPLRLGKWVKKSALPELENLLITLVLFAAAPGWQNIWNRDIVPLLDATWRRLREAVPGSATAHMFVGADVDGGTFQIRCASMPPGTEDAAAHHGAIASAHAIAEIVRSAGQRAAVVRLTFNEERGAFGITCVETREGHLIATDEVARLIELARAK